MSANTVFPVIRALAVAVPALALAGCEVNVNTTGVTATERRTFDVSGRAEVLLETFDGPVEVRAWDRPQVDVEIVKRGVDQKVLDEISIQAEQDGPRVALRVAGPRGETFQGITIGNDTSPQARLRVALPRTSDLAVTSGDGSIIVEDISGRVEMTTRDGSVRAERVEGTMRVRSGDGSVRLRRVRGALDIETEDGSITLDAVPTALKAVTADGSIRVAIGDAVSPAADWELRTGDGSVSVELPAGFDAELDAESSDGRVSVRSQDPDADGPSRERGPMRAVKTTLGNGGRTLTIRTREGNIRVQN